MGFGMVFIACENQAAGAFISANTVAVFNNILYTYWYL